MSEHILWFRNRSVASAVCLPFDLGARVEDWQSVRRAMLRGPSAGFTRDEWAYLIGYLDPSVLMLPFERSFGQPSGDAATAGALFRPRGGLAIWLPNNASLLGPLVLVMASLAGIPVRAKCGSRAQDLASEFVSFSRGTLADCPLRRYLEAEVDIRQFGRDDPLNAEMSLWAASRIVFGGDDAARGVSSLAHHPSCRTFVFGDHRSEAWVNMALMDDASAVMLGRVFAIYGRAGCTSPSKVLILGGTIEDACRLSEQLVRVWQQVAPQRPGEAVASECVMAAQLARAAGACGGVWLAPSHGAVIVADKISTICLKNG